ncbi:ketoacyl-ACP synthase III [Alteribacillus bidgolensis]|uniref:Beta-ketoacyl-[acyl-carrier-protein] synthase III n=1 Tax=Alteribacillus bidgolensis TaxID=930129 RepID=A0A1G8NGC5_9BACI|nr:ketoacyl-ACP synthase III [Alteribacillus bidgolensis]SDI79192.1 3-oxoacyl-[acyl-carrier-protein] synthase III [Alteribacillus bidgolensis]
MTQSKARITAIGSYIPERVLSNADLENIVDTNNEWIVQRTGMKERRITSENEFTSDLCIKAVKNLMQNYDKTVDDVDLIIVSTTTADFVFPSVACQLQETFKMKSTGAFDLNATCAGFTYGLHVANGLISSGLHKKILVIGGETLSKATDYTDRSTCVLFGDGAGAVLVEYDEENPSFISSVLGTNGEGGIHLYRSGLSKEMNGMKLLGDGNMVQNGREVYKWAVRSVPIGLQTLLEKAHLRTEDIDWFVPHSANLRMIESICEKSHISMDNTLYSVKKMGNTSSASIPLALDLGIKEQKLHYGDTVVLYGFGGGLTYTGIIIKWGVPDR